MLFLGGQHTNTFIVESLLLQFYKKNLSSFFCQFSIMEGHEGLFQRPKNDFQFKTDL